MVTAEKTILSRVARRSGLSKAELLATERIPAAIDYVDHPSFELAETEQELFGHDRAVNVPLWTEFPQVPEENHRSSRKRTSVTASEEVQLFLRYNYARYRLAKVLAAQGRRFAAGRARQAILWHGRVRQCRSDLVHANLALVLAMGRRTRISGAEFSEMVSEGNMALLRSIEKFDVSRGFKFSTYACRSILKSFNRLATKTGRYRSHFPAEYDPDLDRSDQDDVNHDVQQDYAVESLREVLDRNRAKLSDVEQTIIRERFALNADGKKRTLADVGQMVSLTNERIRQIQNGALGKLRTVLNEQYLAG